MPIREPLVLIAAVAFTLVLFASLGVIVGVYAQSWDFPSFVQNIVIVPLSFLGGTFYSVERLPALALGVTAALAAAMVGWSSWLFATGRKLKA